MTQRIPIPSFPYSNLHYSYINPASSYRNRNVEKRQRQKDNYADLYLEKKNYVTYEIDPTATSEPYISETNAPIAHSGPRKINVISKHMNKTTQTIGSVSLNNALCHCCNGLF